MSRSLSYRNKAIHAVDDALVVPITSFAGVNPIILSKIKSIECALSDFSKRLYKSPMQ